MRIVSGVNKNKIKSYAKKKPVPNRVATGQRNTSLRFKTTTSLKTGIGI